MQTYSEDFRLWRKYARSRPRMYLLGIVRGAVPVALVTVDVIAQERKQLDLLDEFVLRMTHAGLDTIPRIAKVCGLDEELVSKVTLNRVADGSLKYLWHTDSFELTAMGYKLVEDLVEIQPVLSEFPITFDCLAWTVSDYPRSSMVAKSDAISDCRTILPFSCNGIPGPAEISPGALNCAIRLKARNELEVLEVRKITVNSYMYLPADLLVFRGDANDDTSVALVIEGKLSQRHDMVLAKWTAQEMLNIGLDSPLDYFDSGLSKDAATKHPLDEKHAVFTGNLDQAPPIAEVRNFQHHELLHRALGTALKRVEISTTRLSGAVVDDHFCRVLEGTLRRRVKVDITYNSETDLLHERHAEQRVLDLQQRHRNLHLRPVAGHNEERLTFDGWQVDGAFPWLNHRAHPHQILRDYTSMLRRLSTEPA